MTARVKNAKRLSFCVDHDARPLGGWDAQND